jgi:hypothetical protein
VLGKYAINGIAVTPKSGNIFVCMNSEILVLGSVMKNTTTTELQVIARLSGHSGSVNCIRLSGNFFVTGGEDGRIILWKLHANTPLKICDIGTPVLSLALYFRTTHELTVSEFSRHAIIAGTNSNIVMLPIPRISAANDDEYVNEAWDNPAVCDKYNKTAILSIECAWGNIYTGSLQGEVKVWTLRDMNKSDKLFKYSQITNMYLLDAKAVHCDAVNALVFYGNHLFSCSSDMSIIAWPAPMQLVRGHGFGFHQDCHNGVVAHRAPVLTLSGNAYALASGDEEGNIVVRAPLSHNSGFTSDFVPYKKIKVTFSFVEYDFHQCILESKSEKFREYEVTLKIKNASHEPLRLQCLFKKSSIFIIEPLSPLTNSLNETGYDIFPFSSVYVKFIFIPTDTIKYETEIPFLVQNNNIHMIRLKGEGVKPALRLENFDTKFDFGCVEVGDHDLIDTAIYNETNSFMYVDCYNYFDRMLEVQDDEDESTYLEDETIIGDSSGANVSMNFNKKKKTIEKVKYLRNSLSELGITITPSSFYLSPHSFMKITIVFTPTEALPPFNVPLRVGFLGGDRILASLNGRSKIRQSNVYDMEEQQYNSMNKQIIYGSIITDLNDAKRLINLQGWNITSGIKSTVLYNYSTNVFLELIEDNNIENSKKKINFSKDEKYVACNTLLQCKCVYDCTVEIWCNNIKMNETEGKGNVCYMQYDVI